MRLLAGAVPFASCGRFAQGVVDVRLMLQRHWPEALAGGGSLQALAAAVLGLSADKSAQRSDWAQRVLSREQVR